MEVENKIEKYSQINKVCSLNWNLQATYILFIPLKYVEDRVAAIDDDRNKIQTDAV